jgi:hypothetical protein
MVEQEVSHLLRESPNVGADPREAAVRERRGRASGAAPG